MKRTFTYKFSDLPLIVDGPFEDNGVEGEAEISYFPDGEWSVGEIGIRTSRRKTAEEIIATGLSGYRICKMHWLDKGTWLFNAVFHRLEHEWRRYVENDVQDQIAGDREYEADEAADHQRDLRKHEVA